jgi:hypothetical protein
MVQNVIVAPANTFHPDRTTRGNIRGRGALWARPPGRTLSMATKAQIEANRRNAQSSTGPVTDAGKAKVRQNALRHGLCAGIPQMSDESQDDVQLLLDTLREEHQPVGATEEILVYKMAEHFFYGKRASYLLSEKLDWADKGDDMTRQINLFLRYHTNADRGFLKALNELRKLQKERRLQEIGSVSQNAQSDPLAQTSVSEPPQKTPATTPVTPKQPPVIPDQASSRPNQPPVPASEANFDAGKAA